MLEVLRAAAPESTSEITKKAAKLSGGGQVKNAHRDLKRFFGWPEGVPDFFGSPSGLHREL